MSKSPSKFISIAILSLAFTTVMAGAAVAPALGMIAEHFSGTSEFLIRQIISLQSIFIIISSFIFAFISRFLDAKTIGIIGITLYLIGGLGAAFVDSIYVLLMFRALLGLGVGLIQPLSTGLVAMLYSKDRQPQMLGSMSAVTSLAALVANPLASYLGSLAWNYSFFIYILGFFILILVLLFLPKVRFTKRESSNFKHILSKNYKFAVGIFLVMISFYSFPTNFSLMMVGERLVESKFIGFYLSIQSLFTLLAGLGFSKIYKKFGEISIFFMAFIYIFGFLAICFALNFEMIVLSLVLTGIAHGFLMPLFMYLASSNSSPQDIAGAMAVMSAGLFLGQFANPYAVKIFEILKFSEFRVAFLMSFFISAILAFWIGFVLKSLKI